MTAADSSARDTAFDVRQDALLRLGCNEGTLRIGGVDAEELVETFGSPLYAYDASIFRQQLAEVRNAMGPRVDVLHCVKANPSLAITDLFRREGAGVEVASAGEILLAKAAGHEGAAMQFAGPGKSEAELRLAGRVGLGCLNLESVAEYEALKRVALADGFRPRVALRVNPAVAVSGSRMAMGGATKKFGIDAAEVVELAQTLVSEDVVDLLGLHTYAGTQSFDAEAWLEHASHVLRLLNEVESATGKAMTSLNLGGGFGVPCFEGDQPFDLARVGDGVQELLAADGRPERRTHVELGRFLVAHAGVYLTRVTYQKNSGGRQHAILDGGMHHHAAAAGLGAILRRTYPWVWCRDVAAERSQSYCLGGPLCTPADELGTAVQLPELSPGDLLAVLVSGAYGLTFSNTMFLSHPTPAEVLVDAGRATVIRAAGDVHDVLRGQSLPDAEPS